MRSTGAPGASGRLRILRGASFPTGASMFQSAQYWPGIYESGKVLIPGKQFFEFTAERELTASK